MDALKKATTTLVFDVESVGLHGVGFAYGAVVVDLKTGAVLEQECFYTEPSIDDGTADGMSWVNQNVMPSLRKSGVELKNLVELRTTFWGLWRKYAAKESALLAADCAWPVEARFLAACVDDAWPPHPVVGQVGVRPKKHESRREGENPRFWQGPYPLIDISTLLAVAPVAVPRRSTELPEHDPLKDAQHSARQLIAALAYLDLRA